MTRIKTIKGFSPSLFLVVTAVISLGGCEFHAAKAAGEARAVSQTLTPPDPNGAENRLYADAINAIEHRDYGTALDELQLARAARPDDPRVFAAMGVVYDKLGRFDLSGRYYSEAEALDPGSKVVAIDRAYSERLQALHSAAERQVVATPVLAPPREQIVLSRIDPAAIGPLAQNRLALTSQILKAGLVVTNENGDDAGTDVVRRYLSRAGWTVARVSGGQPGLEAHVAYPAPRRPDGVKTYLARLEKSPSQRTAPRQPIGESRLLYPSYAPRVARALARSLPFPVTLVTCDGCTRLKLILGHGVTAGAARPRTIG